MKNLSILKMSPEERRLYEKYLADLVIQRDVLETARNEGAEAKGLEIAKKMYSQGMDIETIASLTGLNLELIKQKLSVK